MQQLHSFHQEQKLGMVASFAEINAQMGSLHKWGQAPFLTFPRADVSHCLMARPLRGQRSGYVYHVLNRGNGGTVVFHKDGDYQAFLHLLSTAKTKFPVHVFGFCLMPNHFHLVLQPGTDHALSAFMHWWQTSHARRYHLHYGGHGHLWQGRYKSFSSNRMPIC